MNWNHKKIELVLKRLVFYTKDIFDSDEYKELTNDLNIVSFDMRRLKKKAHVEMKNKDGKLYVFDFDLENP